jgi:aminopeptidase N
MAKPEVKYLKDYKVPEYLINTIDLYVNLDEEITSVKTTMKIIKNPESKENSKKLVLNGEEIELKSLFLDKKNTNDYEVNEEFLIINNVPDEFELTIVNTLHPEKNSALEGLYKSGKMFLTQCEAEGFRKITYFIDRPDVMSVFTCTIEADIYRYPYLLSNGNLISKKNLLNGRHIATWHDPYKKPSYLFALVAGDLSVIEDKFTTMSGKNLKLQIFVEHENKDKCDFAMESLKKAMKWDEERFGREYDLDLYMIVATNDFNMGAMENKGLNIFNSKYVLAKTETATDMDFEAIEAVIAHEYFHNWTGNRITLKSWFELSLKEGLTVFRDQEFSADMNSRSIQRIKDVINLRIRQFPEDAGPMAHPIRPDSYIEMNNFYTMTVYEKGAEVVRMIYTILGKDNFRKAMDLYFERFDGMAVTTEDFVKIMEESSGIDLKQFRLWYSQAGTPEVKVERSFKNNTYELKITQTIPKTPNQKNKKPMHIPIKFALLDKNGNEIDIDTDILHLKEKEQIFSFENIKEEPIPSLLRNFSAPVKLEVDYTEEELIFLAMNETDDFNRWEALQKIFSKAILSLVESIQNNRELSIEDYIIESFKSVLLDKNLDKSFIALAISLPSESDIWEQLEIIDVEAVFKAREFMFATIAESLEDILLKTYNENQSEVFDMTPISISKRKLKNTVLNYLSYIKDNKYLSLIFEQFEKADNMTDKISALAILANIESEQSKIAIEAFYEHYKNDTLVLDKWFSIQATSKLENTLQKVISLISHPAFSIRNPNKVRALIGAFCSANKINFHNIDGSGYKFLTEVVITLNELNPQIAARMLSIFNNWRRFDEKRQELMKKELERISKLENLSKDVYEIVTKALK